MCRHNQVKIAADGELPVSKFLHNQADGIMIGNTQIGSLAKSYFITHKEELVIVAAVH